MISSTSSLIVRVALLRQSAAIRRNITTCTSFDGHLVAQNPKTRPAPGFPDTIDSTFLETEYFHTLTSYQLGKLKEDIMTEIDANKLEISRHMEAIGRLKDSVNEIEQGTAAMAILISQIKNQSK